jgi:hypothetical protein
VHCGESNQAAESPDPSKGTPSQFELAATATEGIYKITAHTLNEDACADGGQPKPASLDHQYILVKVNRLFFGLSYLNILSCSSPEDCLQSPFNIDEVPSTAVWNESVDFSYWLTEIDENGHLSGERTMVSGPYDIPGNALQNNGQCGGWIERLVLKQESPETFQLENDITFADPYPQDSNGVCQVDDVTKHAEANTCTQKEILTATLYQSLESYFLDDSSEDF